MPRPLLLLLILAPLAPAAAAQTRWTLEAPADARETGTLRDSRLAESSGIAASRRSPGVLWTHNDSGDGPFVYAIDTTGALLATFRVTGARNVDWEDIALGPCGAGTCLYLGDTGDNAERRRSVTLYRIPEPVLPASRPRTARATRRAEAVALRYPDGPHDVEAIWVAPNGDAHLVSKGRVGPARHYRVPAAAWMSRRLVTAEAVEQLPVRQESRLDRVTGAALSPDARIVAVRTYTAVYFFFPGPAGNLVVPPDPLACDVRGLGLQGEGVSWLDDRRLVLTSERAILPAGPIAVAQCPLPQRMARR